MHLLYFILVFNLFGMFYLYINICDTVEMILIKNYNTMQAIVSFGMMYDEENILNLDLMTYRGGIKTACIANSAT